MKSVVVTALLATAALRPLAAQQIGSPVAATSSVAPAPASQAAAANALPGPRAEPQWRSYEPSLVGDRAADRGASSRGDTHTIRMTTLTLVLVVVILVLLIA